MRVEAENPICASWTTLQEIKMGIDPLPVQASTLTGKTVYTNKKATVFSED